jgi:type I restriction enzyme S subunit
MFGGERTHFVSEEKAAELAAHSVCSGDVLITKMGDPPGDTCIYPADQPPGIITADCIKFRPSSFAGDGRYFVYAIQSPLIRKRIVEITTGVAQQKVSLGRFANLFLPIAPLSEQRRIVAKIEELFSDLDAGVAALERVRANVKRYRAAVLKAAVEGKLTADWRAQHPDTEPASVLLDRILTERRRHWEKDQLAKFAQAGKQSPKGWQLKYKAPIRAQNHTAQDEDGTAYDLPGGWTWASIDELAVHITKGSSPGWQGFDYVESGIPFVRSQNVRWGLLDLNELVYIAPAFNLSHMNSVINEGDVLLNLVGASVGRSAIASREVHGANSNQAVGIIRVASSSISNKLLMLFLLSPHLQNYIGDTKADVARANFNLDDVRPTPVPLPPTAEQEQIVAEVERRLSIVDEIEAQVEANLKRAARLRQGILKRAFEGRLVPQDPTDESAEVLLARIRSGTSGGSDLSQSLTNRRSLRRAAKVRSDSQKELFDPCEDVTS